MSKMNLIRLPLWLAALWLVAFDGIGQEALDYQAAFDSANAAYARGEYMEAQAGYETILQDRIHFESEFNLGNAFFKQNALGSAILHFERARQLDPNHDDLESNLTLANSRIQDRIEPIPTSSINDLWLRVIAPGRFKLWMRLLVGTWTLGFAAFALRLWQKEPGSRRLLGTLGGTLLSLSLIFFSLTALTSSRIDSSKSAIIMATETSIRNAPGPNGMTLFVLHEGTKVKILQRERDFWKIELINGNVGWIMASDVTEI